MTYKAHEAYLRKTCLHTYQSLPLLPFVFSHRRSVLIFESKLQYRVRVPYRTSSRQYSSTLFFYLGSISYRIHL